MPPRVEEWEWDDGNLSELARHDADENTVLDVWEEKPRYRRNTKGYPGYRMIGPDLGGTLWTIIILSVDGKTGLWRAVTGWTLHDGDNDLSWYMQQTRKGKKK